MGQSSSVDNAQFYGDQNCIVLSNDELVYRTRQYASLNKIVAILDQIIAGTLQLDISHPENYIVDNQNILADMYSNQPFEISATLFPAIPEVYGVHNGQVLKRNITILDVYNNFFLKQIQVMTDAKDISARAEMIKEQIIPIAENILALLNQQCLQ